MIGKIEKRDGKIVISRGWSGEGWIYKNEEAYAKNMNAVCYIPELSDTMYTGSDIVRICRGQKEIADRIFAALNWDHPESRLDDQGEELVECPCGALYWRYADDGDEVECCPYCKTSVDEADNFEKKCGRIPGKKVVLHDKVSVWELCEKLTDIRDRREISEPVYQYAIELWNKIDDIYGCGYLCPWRYTAEARGDFLPYSPETLFKLELKVLDGADNWVQYAYTSSLVENQDIADRLGVNPATSEDELIRLQAKCLVRAWEAIKSAFNSLYGKAEEVVL